jgi:hypothetical protein
MPDGLDISGLNKIALMARNLKNGNGNGSGDGGKAESSPDLWIAPNHSLKGAHGERAWENRRGGPPNSSRLIELADIALGLKKPSQRKRKMPLGVHPTTHKTEPYLE